MSEVDALTLRIARLEAVLTALLQNAGPDEEQRLGEIDSAMWAARKVLAEPPEDFASEKS